MPIPTMPGAAGSTEHACSALHQLVRAGRRFRYPFDNAAIPSGGIYIMFEEGEQAHGGERIVRIGTHKGTALARRLRNHFGVARRRGSILQRHIGRCLLDGSVETLSIWNTKRPTSSLPPSIAETESRALDVLRRTFSFALVTVDASSDRLRLEAALISTVAQCPACGPSADWLGRRHPNLRFREKGLWNVQGLDGKPLTADDIAREIVPHIVR